MSYASTVFVPDADHFAADRLRSPARAALWPSRLAKIRSSRRWVSSPLQVPQDDDTHFKSRPLPDRPGPPDADALVAAHVGIALQPLGDHDDAVVFPQGLGPDDPRDTPSQSRRGISGIKIDSAPPARPAHKADKTRLPAHHLDDVRPVMARRGVPDLVDPVDDRVDGRIKTDRSVRTPRCRCRSSRELLQPGCPVSRQSQRPAEGAVAANDDHPRNTGLL